ncbi:MAG: response regulator [Patescibacteria group bacterium]|nr:response regulator [Patescibacteria group bacterium]
MPYDDRSVKTKKIMIIEDEKALLSLMEKKLSKGGYIPITAPTGTEGLKKIREYKPDLILLDIVIPDKNGYEVLEEIHNDPFLNQIPVIIISNSEPDEKKIFALGARDYLVKADLTPEDILKKIETYFNKEESPKPVSAAQKGEGEACKIVLIEDDAILRDLCLIKLQKENFTVITAIEGQEGLHKIEEEKPDVVLLDIILPGMDGFEVLKRMRALQNKAVAKTPVILLTNLGQENDIKKGEALGAEDYIIKANSTTEEIIDKVRKVIQKSEKGKK